MLHHNSKCLNTSIRNNGIRQGENISHILFALFLTDLVACISKVFDGLSDNTEATHLHVVCDN